MTVLGNNHLNVSPQSTQISQAEASATGTKIIRHLWRPALDAGLALALFMIATLTLASAPSSASPGVNLGLIQFTKPSAEPTQTQRFSEKRGGRKPRFNLDSFVGKQRQNESARFATRSPS